MKTLKTVTVLLFTAALFFSCTQENNNYGTLVINPSGVGSSRSITAVFEPEDFYDGFENGLTYTFECINQKDNTKVGTAQFGVKKSNDAKIEPNDVQIQLLPGNWDVWVKVLKNGKEIGSNKYPTVAIKAGQTIILGGLNVEIQGFSYGSAVAPKAPPGFDYEDVGNPGWSSTPLNINRFIVLNKDPVDGQAKQPPTVDPNGTGAHGTARILWGTEEDNKKYLYVLVLVEGAECTGYNHGDQLTNAHNTDSVEIFVHEGGDTAYQYRIAYAEIANAAVKTYGVATAPSNPNDNWTHNNTNANPTGAILNIADNPPIGAAYAVTAKIPLTSEEKNIGVELQINGAPETQNGFRSSIAVWCSESSPYNQPWRYEKTLTLIDD